MMEIAWAGQGAEPAGTPRLCRRRLQFRFRPLVSGLRRLATRDFPMIAVCSRHRAGRRRFVISSQNNTGSARLRLGRPDLHSPLPQPRRRWHRGGDAFPPTLTGSRKPTPPTPPHPISMRLAQGGPPCPSCHVCLMSCKPRTTFSAPSPIPIMGTNFSTFPLRWRGGAGRVPIFRPSRRPALLWRPRRHLGTAAWPGLARYASSGRPAQVFAQGYFVPTISPPSFIAATFAAAVPAVPSPRPDNFRPSPHFGVPGSPAPSRPPSPPSRLSMFRALDGCVV